MTANVTIKRKLVFMLLLCLAKTSEGQYRFPQTVALREGNHTAREQKYVQI